MEPDREKLKTVLAYAYMAIIILITFALLMWGS